ncbi:MAG TPA: DNA polymerase III subunit beta [Geminicoccaceae bacterium]|nr:DNA polymerase III subunit beta [Geminicoccaceae bacterium]
MKLSIERAALLKSLAHVQNVVERRTTIPILSNVKLSAGDGELVLTATDMDLSLLSRETAEVRDGGTTTVSAHLLFDIVRKLPEGSEVTLEQVAGAPELTLTAARSVFNLPSLPADEFPAMGEEQLDVRFEMAAAELARLIDKTRFAISTEETRYYLNGIHLHATRAGAASMLRAVATDGHRLARVETALPAGAEQIPPVIVPRKTVGEVRKLIDGVVDNVTIGVSPGRIQFLVDRAMLVSRLIDGTFPDYERVIPSGNERVAIVPAKPFADAVDRVATISTEKARAVKLAFEQGRATVSAVSAEAGRATEELDAEYGSGALEIGFNARYILDMMAQITGQEVRLEMANAAAPTLVRDPGDDSTIYVLMPMRV